MSLRINGVYLSLIDSGPAIGCRGLFIDIKETKKPQLSLAEQLQIKLDEKENINGKDISKQIFYNTAIDGTKRTYLCFLGGAIDRKDNYREWCDLSEEISKQSVQLQKDYKINQISPPFMIFFGKPQYITGSVGDSGFYQHFNCITGIIHQETESSNLESFNKISAQEIINHPFGSLILKIDHYKVDEDIDAIIKPIIDTYTISNKIYICDNCPQSAIRLQEYCLLSGLRYQKQICNSLTIKRSCYNEFED